MRGLLVTQAAELETGLRTLLPLLETLLAKSPAANTGPKRPATRVTGLGSALTAVIRRIVEAGSAGVLPDHEVIRAQLEQIGTARDIRNRAAHEAIRTEYAHDGVDWQPVWAWYGDGADADVRDLAKQLTQLKDATVLLANVYWQLRSLTDPPASE